MANLEVQRRLAAILAADVAGYTRLMEQDEAGTVKAWRALRSEIIDPGIDAFKGRIVKLTGDGFLAEFPTVEAAVDCALTMQSRLTHRIAETPDQVGLDFRMGVHLGDIYADDEDIYGDGVNIAARLEALSEPGAVCISADVYNQVQNKLNADFKDIGENTLKNISKPVRAYMVHPAERLDRPAAPRSETENLEQDIRFCVAPDGVGLAYSAVGEGPVIVKTANWLSHLEFDFKSHIWRPWIEELSDGYSILRYDARGNGLSDWDVDDISFDAWVSDLEVVVDAAQVDRFALFGLSQGCAVSLAYAVGHPDKLSHLILFAGAARGRFKRPGAQPEQEKAIDTLLQLGWGSESHPLSQTLAANLMADGGPREQAWWVGLQRMTTSPNNAVRIRQVLQTYDVEDLLPEVSVPTLVLHCEGDTAVPFEEGRRMASRIPGARFVSLPGRNHILIDGQEAWGRFFSEVRNFLKS